MGKKVNRNRDYHPDEQFQETYNQNGLKRKRFHLKDLASIQARSKNQHTFLDEYINTDKDVFALLGCPGTGKTLLAMYGAMYDVLDTGTPYDKVVILRSAVETRDTGFKSGDEKQKDDVFSAPYRSLINDVFKIKYDKIYENLEDIGKLVFRSTSNLRGMTFENAIIIIDEVQNMNYEEVKTAYTRGGHNTRIIMCGDYAQNDLTKKNSDKSGLEDWMCVMSNTDCYRVDFTAEDIVRHGRIKDMIKAEIKLGLV